VVGDQARLAEVGAPGAPLTAMAPTIGDAAPDFTLTNQHGESVSLSAFRGSKDVVIVFYPFAFSSVCTAELQALRDHLEDFSDDTTELLAISCDPMFSLRAYADRDGYAFSLLSDFWPHGEVARAYDAFDSSGGCASRLTVLVDRQGVVRWQVANEIPDARNLDDYRSALRSMR
jgi:mycoredoxin-dependent peroxiredoxin